MYNDAYKGKTVLVTGHTGFKGSYLCEALLKYGPTPIHRRTFIRNYVEE